jgi:hypothetical protein
MDKAKRARTAETPKQPSPGLQLRAPYLYPDLESSLGNIASRPCPKIYYVHPAIVGPLEVWSGELQRCREMGFDYVATAPIFAPGEAGDIFLTGDFERLHPIFGSDIGVDDVVAKLANKCRQNELKLIIDIVLDRVDPNGPLALSQSRLSSRGDMASGQPIRDRGKGSPKRQMRDSAQLKLNRNSSSSGASVWVGCSMRALRDSDSLIRIMCHPICGMRLSSA